MQSLRSCYRSFYVLFIALFMAACGGGGGSLTQDGDGSLGQTPPEEPPPEPVYAITLELLNSNGEVANTTPVSQDAPGTLRATLTLDGAPIQFQLVTFSTAITGVLNPSLGTAQTNEQGMATVTLLPGNQEGAGQATAEYSLPDGGVVSTTLAFTSAGDAPSATGDNDVKITMALKSGVSNATTTVISAAETGGD